MTDDDAFLTAIRPFVGARTPGGCICDSYTEIAEDESAAGGLPFLLLTFHEIGCPFEEQLAGSPSELADKWAAHVHRCRVAAVREGKPW